MQSFSHLVFPHLHSLLDRNFISSVVLGIVMCILSHIFYSPNFLVFRGFLTMYFDYIQLKPNSSQIQPPLGIHTTLCAFKKIYKLFLSVLLFQSIPFNIFL